MPSSSRRPSRRLRIASAVRCALVAGLTITVVAVLSEGVDALLLSSTLGPTAYVFAAHPRSTTSRLRNAVLGHLAALLVSAATALLLGVPDLPKPTAEGQLETRQAVSLCLAVGLTLLVLELADLHHAPAAATAVLVASGATPLGRPTVDLAIGLGVVIAVGPVLARVGGRVVPPTRPDLDTSNQRT